MVLEKYPLFPVLISRLHYSLIGVGFGSDRLRELVLKGMIIMEAPFFIIDPNMYIKLELPWNVRIPPKRLNAKGIMLQKSIILHLMKDFSKRKSTKDQSYYLALTTYGEGKVRQESGGVLFHVTLNCITFKPVKDEVLKGNVNKVMKQGVLWSCIPIDLVFIASLAMPDYDYVQKENPVIMNESLSKVEKDVAVRFLVIGVKWMESMRGSLSSLGAWMVTSWDLLITSVCIQGFGCFCRQFFIVNMGFKPLQALPF